MNEGNVTPLSELKNILDAADFEYYRNSVDGLNFHSLLNWMKNPRLAHCGYFDSAGEATPEMIFGTQFHALALQGAEVFERENALWRTPVNPKTGEAYGSAAKAYKESAAEWETENPGKVRYSEADKERFERMLDALHRHPLASEILFESKAEKGSEVVFNGIYNDLLLKGSIDRYDSEWGIVDLKTTGCVMDRNGYRKFRYRTIPDYGYLEQLAFYQIGIKEVCGADDYPPSCIVAVETAEPYQVEVFFPVYQAGFGARDEVYRWIDFYKECVESGRWPNPLDEPTYLNTYRPSRRYMSV